MFFRDDYWSLQCWFPHVSRDALLVITDYSCAVVHTSIQVEPRVEFLVVNPISAPNIGLQSGRNPRRLCLGFESDSEEQFGVANIYDRHYMPRHWLERIRPSTWQLKDNNLVTLTTWLARRYTRPVFADEFNNRTKKVMEKIKKKFKQSSQKEAVDGILSFALDLSKSNEDLDQAENYELGVILVISKSTILKYEDQYKELANFIDGLFEQCAGINYFGTQIIGEDDLTVSESRTLKLYDLDSITLASNEGQLVSEHQL